jgi:CubicO group peptidase (beta-lactamase class C family)
MVVLNITASWEQICDVDLIQNLVTSAVADWLSRPPGSRRGLERAATRHCEARFNPARIDLARERCARWVEEGHTPSLVVLAARNGVIALHEAFGQRTPAGDPLRPDTIYPVLSVSKPLTAAPVLTLVEDGLLGLNRPASPTCRSSPARARTS